MNILVTGAKGFIGKNLIATLNNIRDGKDKSFKPVHFLLGFLVRTMMWIQILNC